MNSQTWLTAGIAGLSVVVSALTTLFTISRQARSHSEQLALQESHFREQLAARERDRRDIAERDHFARLWQTRQESYLRLTTSAVKVRRALRAARRGGDWQPPDSLESEALAQILVYADFDVYREGELFRGGYEQSVENLERFRDQLTPESRTRLLERIDEDAWALIHTVREHALRVPEWREPIPLHPQSEEDAS